LFIAALVGILRADLLFGDAAPLLWLLCLAL